jgi:hypothetical protein
VATLNRWFGEKKDKADFRVIYIAEAHPTDGWQVPANERAGVLVKTHQTMADRKLAAAKLRDELGLKIPIVVDGMDDAVQKAYSGWPDRIFIVDVEGKIAYRGAPGPRGFLPAEAMRSLDALLAP